MNKQNYLGKKKAQILPYYEKKLPLKEENWELKNPSDANQKLPSVFNQAKNAMDKNDNA